MIVNDRIQIDQNTLKVFVEDGSIYLDSFTGDWCGSELWEYFGMDDLAVVSLIEDNPDMAFLLTAGKCFVVTFRGVRIIGESGGWDLDHGYVNPEWWIEYESYESQKGQRPGLCAS